LQQLWCGGAPWKSRGSAGEAADLVLYIEKGKKILCFNWTGVPQLWVASELAFEVPLSCEVRVDGDLAEVKFVLTKRSRCGAFARSGEKKSRPTLRGPT
jgi:hypothetical protein